ncbi:MAG: ribonuclease J [Firmicutes bacterium]|nr:ribonuclease J [Bacillota bacterium]
MAERIASKRGAGGKQAAAAGILDWQQSDAVEEKRKRTRQTAGKKSTAKTAGGETAAASKGNSKKTTDSAAVTGQGKKRKDPAAGGGEKSNGKARKQSESGKNGRGKKQNPLPEERSSSHAFVSNPLANDPLSLRSNVSGTDKHGGENGSERKLKIIPLGGMGEVGKNMTVIQYGEQIVVVDAGVMFPTDEMLGIDLVIPDYSYLIEHRQQVQAFLLTHGHEDHIGALPYLLKDIEAPVYGSRLTLGLVKGKLNEHRIEADLRQVAPRETINAGVFKVEFFRITHSIPDSMGMAVHTPVGVILLISDFKIDMSPIDGRLMDLSRIAALGEKGVLLLMADSTNVERDGYTGSEKTIGSTFEKLFSKAEGRIILTTFASNVHRVQQAMWAAERSGRKVAIVGRGMQNVCAIARELGYLQIPDDILIGVEEVNSLPAHKILILTTGSQGEPLSGLTRMSSGEHRQVHIIPGDLVIISATPIPGNERTVARTVDNLFRQGAMVVHERSEGTHVSGHGSKEELKILINMVKPRFFLPMHGEYRMLYKHAQLAQFLGMALENTFVMENGQILEVGRRHCRINGSVTSGQVLIDGLGVGDVGNYVLKERRQLSESGIIIVNLVYSRKKEPHILYGPEIISRGFIFEKEYEHIIGEAKEKVAALCTDQRLTDGSLYDLRNQLRSVLGRFVLERTGRRPVIIDVINEV